MSAKLPAVEHSLPAFSSRRRAPRLSVDYQLQGRVFGVDADIEVVDISFGGVSLSSSRPFENGVRHVLRFLTDSGLAVEIPARVVHCHPAHGESPRYHVGWEFLPQTGAEDAVMPLIDAVTGSLSFDV
jgi:hypothetical protein